MVNNFKANAIIPFGKYDSAYLPKNIILEKY